MQRFDPKKGYTKDEKYTVQNKQRDKKKDPFLLF